MKIEYNFNFFFRIKIQNLMVNVGYNSKTYDLFVKLK